MNCFSKLNIRVKMKNKIYRLIKSPMQVLSIVLNKILLFKTREYVAEPSSRSDSENGYYIRAVYDSLRGYKSFSNFKRNPNYQSVLEHVTKDQGQAYLDILTRAAPTLLTNIEQFKINDIVGNPFVFEYKNVGFISPTTLRYVKVAADLNRLFGNDVGDQVVEIGVGYGGQALIFDKIFMVNSYELIDLPPVLKLASKYLESHILSNSYKVSTLNQKTGKDEYDLVISNYAFSELPEKLQLMYIKKILIKSKKGYLTMNSGKTDISLRGKGKLTLQQLKNLLPPFELLEEDPLTGPDNYIIVWGHKK